MRETKKIDADIYLDVDGVLFCENNGILELRHGFVDFLWFLVNNFENCYWLTCWGTGFNDVLEKIYAGRIARKFKDSNWKHGPTDKASGIQDWNRKFIWIEDGLCEGAIAELKKHNCMNNYIHVPFSGEMDYLYKVKDILIERFNIVTEKERMSEIKKTLKEWEEIKGLEIIDYDGFDRSDTKLFERLFTEKEFDKGSPICTQYIKANKNMDYLVAEVERLKKENEELKEMSTRYIKGTSDLIKKNGRLRTLLKYNNMDLLCEENKQLKEGLKKCNKDRTWCYSCRCPMGNLKYGEQHSENCEYIKLIGGDGK